MLIVHLTMNIDVVLKQTYWMNSIVAQQVVHTCESNNFVHS